MSGSAPSNSQAVQFEQQQAAEAAQKEAARQQRLQQGQDMIDKIFNGQPVMGTRSQNFDWSQFNPQSRLALLSYGLGGGGSYDTSNGLAGLPAGYKAVYVTRPGAGGAGGFGGGGGAAPPVNTPVGQTALAAQGPQGVGPQPDATTSWQQSLAAAGPFGSRAQPDPMTAWHQRLATIGPGTSQAQARAIRDTAPPPATPGGVFTNNRGQPMTPTDSRGQPMTPTNSQGQPMATAASIAAGGGGFGGGSFGTPEWAIQGPDGKIYYQGDQLSYDTQYDTGKRSGGFDDAFYNQYRQKYLDYYNPEETKQYGEAQRDLKYNLARSGNLISSVAGDKTGDLAYNDALAKASIAANANTETGKLRDQIQANKEAAISQLYSTEDPTLAANLAQSSANASRLQDPSLTPAGQFFTPALTAVGAAAGSYFNPYGSSFGATTAGSTSGPTVASANQGSSKIYKGA